MNRIPPIVPPTGPAPTVRSVAPAFANQWLTVLEVEVCRKGEQSRWYYLDHPGCALVLPIVEGQQIALVRTWRPAVRAFHYEAPCGGLQKGETATEAARREIKEEIGGDCAELVPLGSTLPSSGTSNEQVFLFAGLGVRLGQSSPDPGEHVETIVLPTAQVLAWEAEGHIQDAPTCLAVLRAQRLGLLDEPGALA